MASSQNVLDNLEDLRLVMSVALDHTQKNLDRFVENATGLEMRRPVSLAIWLTIGQRAEAQRSGQNRRLLAVRVA